MRTSEEKRQAFAKALREMAERECAVFDATSALPTRFCPNCGAEVVPHAERRD